MQLLYLTLELLIASAGVRAWMAHARLSGGLLFVGGLGFALIRIVILMAPSRWSDLSNLEWKGVSAANMTFAFCYFCVAFGTLMLANRLLKTRREGHS